MKLGTTGHWRRQLVISDEGNTFILFFVLIGILLIPLLFAMGIAWLVLAIIGGVKANRGEAYRYPLTIRMVS